MSQAPENLRVFEYQSRFDTTLETITAFHADPKVFSRLIPPPMFIQVLRDDRTSLTEGELEFRLWFGPVPVRWLARHEPGPTPHAFVDRMIVGPLAFWVHQHIFTPVDGGVELTDHITLAHKPGWRGMLTRMLFEDLPLRLLFEYRHFRTRLALSKS